MKNTDEIKDNTDTNDKQPQNIQPQLNMNTMPEINEEKSCEPTNDDNNEPIKTTSDTAPTLGRRMQTVLPTNSDNDDEETQLSRACAALQRYYYSLDTDYYKDLQTFIEDNGEDIEACLNDGIESDLMGFDQKGNNKPFPFPPRLQNIEESLKLLYKFDIIKKCYNNPDTIFENVYPKALLSTTTIKELYNITKQEFEDAVKLYQKQCPAIFNIGGMKSDNSLIYLVAISLKYKFDYIQTMAQIYLRERIDKYMDETSWSVQDFCNKMPHCVALKNMQIERPWEVDEKQKDVTNSTNPGTAYEVLTHGISTYGKRCIPYMVYTAPWAINDSLEITTRYIHAMIKFINQILNESHNLQKAVTPFQLDLVLSYSEPISRGIIYCLYICYSQLSQPICWSLYRG